MDKSTITFIIIASVGLLFAPNHFRRSRPHGIAYLIGLLILTTILFFLMHHIYGYYQNALGPE